jgi:hypothetical protein
MTACDGLADSVMKFLCNNPVYGNGATDMRNLNTVSCELFLRSVAIEYVILHQPPSQSG